MTRQLEPEYDDATRALIEGADLHDVECCPGCGIHKTILDDPEHNGFTFEERHCPVCAAQDVYGRIVADRDEKDRKRLSEQRPEAKQPGDGRHVYLRRMTDDELEQRRQREG